MFEPPLKILHGAPVSRPNRNRASSWSIVFGRARNSAGPPRRNPVCGASGSEAVTIARKSSGGECIGYLSHIAVTERQQHVAGLEMLVEVSHSAVEVSHPARRDSRISQSL